MVLTHRRLLKTFLLMAALLLAAWALRGQFAEASLPALLQAWRAQSTVHIASAMALTAVSFACLGLYDLAAAHVVAPSVNSAWAWMTGVVANAVSNTLGFHAVTGTLVRARLYGQRGLRAGDVARIVSLSWLALGLGFIAMLALAESLDGLATPAHRAHLVLGFALACGLGGLITWLAHAPATLRFGRFRQPLPPARLAVLQLAIGAVESAAAIGALYVLLPPDLAPSFSLFAAGYISAVALGVLSHVPGGVGVFEASMTALLWGAGRTDLLAALLLYRAIYNLLPFVLSLPLLVALGAPRLAQLDGG
jgi:phosphatidylglycerol lysyltransferase